MIFRTLVLECFNCSAKMTHYHERVFLEKIPLLHCNEVLPCFYAPSKAMPHAVEPQERPYFLESSYISFTGKLYMTSSNPNKPNCKFC